MRKQIVLLVVSGLLINLSATAQQNSINEKDASDKMKAEGLSDAVINKLIEQRKEFEKNGRKLALKTIDHPVPFAACADIGVENGWSAWTGAFGTNSSFNPPVWNVGPTNPPPASNANSNISITSGTNIDPCTPGTAPGAPSIPLVAPGFGNYSIQLGVQQMPGCYAEQAVFSLSVTAADKNFVYSYALVFYDPVSGHLPAEKPFADFVILDANGDTIPCSFQHYVSWNGAPGWYQQGGACSGGTDVWYKPWSTAGVDLSAYIGQTVTIVITNGDCVFCGHWAHSYWDFSCGNNAVEVCAGQPQTICGPSNPYAPSTYQWHKNGNIMPGDTLQCLALPSPTGGDVYSVFVKQPSGCNYYMNYQLQDTCGTTSVENIPHFSFSLYPNPARDELYIDPGKGFQGAGEIFLADPVGKVLVKQSVNDIEMYRLDITELAEGIYFIEFRMDAGAATKKFSVNR